MLACGTEILGFPSTQLGVNSVEEILAVGFAQFTSHKWNTQISVQSRSGYDLKPLVQLSFERGGHIRTELGPSLINIERLPGTSAVGFQDGLKDSGFLNSSSSKKD